MSYDPRGVRIIRQELEGRLAALNAYVSASPDSHVNFQEAFDHYVTSLEVSPETMTPHHHYLALFSSARDKAKWPSPSEYQVTLGTPLEHVTSATLVQASVPMGDQQVVVLDVDAFNADFHGISGTTSAFAFIVSQDDGTIHLAAPRGQPSPHTRLQTLRVKLLRPDGTPHDTSDHFLLLRVDALSSPATPAEYGR